MANARGRITTTHSLGWECWKERAKTSRKLDMLCFKHKDFVEVKELVTVNKCAENISAVLLFDHLLKLINSFENQKVCKKPSKILSLSLVILFEMLLKVRKTIQTARHQESSCLLAILPYISLGSNP